MQVIVKKNGKYSLININKDILENMQSSYDEVILDIPFTQEEITKIEKGCDIINMEVVETQMYLDNLTSEKALEIRDIENKLLKLSSEKKGAEELIAFGIGIETYEAKLETINKEMSELVVQLQKLIK